MSAEEDSAKRLLDRVTAGESSAAHALLRGNRERIKRMIAVYWDDHLAARCDPSDVVQETMITAAQRLPAYSNERNIPFYPWLRAIAWERLMQLRHHHVGVQKRSVNREETDQLQLSDASVVQLADRLAGGDSSPSQYLLRAEMKQQVRAALARLSSAEREVLVLRYLEQLEPAEASTVLNISVEAFTKRHMRAIKHVRGLLKDIS